MANKDKTFYRRLRAFFWSSTILLTIVLALLLYWISRQIKNDVIEIATMQARSSFQKDALYIRWAAMQGGVYVPESFHTPPDSLLDSLLEKSALTPSGKKLTLVTPAYLSRLVNNTQQNITAAGHMRSLNPISEKNAPDNWETWALYELIKGNREVKSVQLDKGEPVIRYMGALKTEESCLNCHDKSKYNLGDIHGGISITISLKPFLAAAEKHLNFIYVVIGGIWFFGVLFNTFFTIRMRRARNIYTDMLAALKREKRYLENLFQNSPEGIVLVDKNSNILTVNDEFVRMFGFSKEELIGKNVDELLTDTSTFREARGITKEVASGKHFYVEGIRYDKNNKPIDVSILGAPMRDADGELQVYGIYRDITERKETERKLIESENRHRQMSEKLNRANSLKELLLDIITHDLKNPAGVIKSIAEIMKSRKPDSEMIEIIQQGSDSILEVIENATALSKISMEESISKENLDLVPLIQKIAEEFKPAVMDADMTLNLELPTSLVVKANPIIGEVIKNFISNAIKYARDGKHIRIAAKENNDGIRVEVIDYGKEIEEDKRQIIFHREVQLEQDEKKKKGLGLGLSIVKKIADAHNARVGVEPNPHGGNIFFIVFPKPRQNKKGSAPTS